MMNCIYCATNLINGKRYIGKTVNGLSDRRKRHERDARKGLKSPFHRALHKYGFDAFTWEVLFEIEDRLLNRWEKYYIKRLKTKSPHGYNLTDGGDGGDTLSNHPRLEEIRKKISIAGMGRKPSEETLIKLRSVKQSAEKREKIRLSNLGRIVSTETRAKISIAKQGSVGHPCSHKTKIKMRLLMKGRKFRLETIEKMRLAAQKRPRPSLETCAKIGAAHKGRRFSAETRAKMSLARKKCWQDPKYRAKILASGSFIGRSGSYNILCKGYAN